MVHRHHNIRNTVGRQKAPAEIKYNRSLRALADLEVEQDVEKKLHKQYIDSLEVVLKQKRGHEDEFIDKEMATFRQQFAAQSLPSPSPSQEAQGQPSYGEPSRKSALVQAMLLGTGDSTQQDRNLNMASTCHNLNRI